MTMLIALFVFLYICSAIGSYFVFKFEFREYSKVRWDIYFFVYCVVLSIIPVFNSMISLYGIIEYRIIPRLLNKFQLYNRMETKVRNWIRKVRWFR